MKHIHTFKSFLNESLNESKIMKIDFPKDPNNNLRLKFKGKKIKAYQSEHKITTVGLGKYVNLGYTAPLSNPNDEKRRLAQTQNRGPEEITVADVLIDKGVTFIGYDSLSDEWRVSLVIEDGKGLVELA